MKLQRCPRSGLVFSLLLLSACGSSGGKGDGGSGGASVGGAAGIGNGGAAGRAGGTASGGASGSGGDGVGGSGAAGGLGGSTAVGGGAGAAGGGLGGAAGMNFGGQGAAGSAGRGAAGSAGQGAAGNAGSPGDGGVGGAGGGGGFGAMGGAAGAAGGAGGHASVSSNKLDLLFMIDNSSSMAPLQQKLAMAFPSVLNAFLTNPVTGQAADLHIAVVSSSLGGGAWANVNQCGGGSHPGDDGGTFQQGPGGARSGSCPALNTGETYLATGDAHTGQPNFTGDIGTVFSCMALLGDVGCGFESQFESVQYALTRAQLPRGLAPGGDPDNGGFLRADARLAIVMLTNEDDCSVPAQSLLLDPGINSAADPTGLGALQSYRCNEFGHLCDNPAGGPKVPPPHTVDPSSPGVSLDGCESAENNGKTESVMDQGGNVDPTMGHLVTVASFVAFLRGLKANPGDIFVAAIAGPPTPYVVLPQANPAAQGEIDPIIKHSCTQMVSSGPPVYADPSVRINQWTQSFGANGFFENICADDLHPTLDALAVAIHGG